MVWFWTEGGKIYELETPHDALRGGLLADWPREGSGSRGGEVDVQDGAVCRRDGHAGRMGVSPLT